MFETLQELLSQSTSRRKMLGGLAVATSVLTNGVKGQVIQKGLTITEKKAVDPTKELGAPHGILGTRSPYEQLSKLPSFTSSRSPLQAFHGMLTPSDLHFERSHAGVPFIDSEQHTLVIHGLVERAMTFTLADLKRFPSVSRICFIECSGNYRSEASGQITPQQICGLTSQSEWTGVSLATLFREVSVKPNAKWFLAEGGDAAIMTRSIPVEKGWEDAIIAYAQNGEAVRPEQGYPFRLLLPGYEGNMSVKWLRRIELDDQPFMTREETSKYTEAISNGKVRQFSFVMDARSIITYPAYPVKLQQGWVEISGLAWSGRGRIQAVEVSTDVGKSWHRAQLNAPVLDKAHVRFKYLWKWDGTPTEIMSRAIDETGYVQPFYKDLLAVRGGNSGYHFNPVTSWYIQADGTILFKST